MSAFLAAFLQEAVGLVILVGLAIAGVILGKKFKEKRNTQ